MPHHTVYCLFNTFPCLDPNTEAVEQQRAGFDTSSWVGKANSYNCPLGPEPGYGYVLLSRFYLNKIIESGINNLYNLEIGTLDESGVVYKSVSLGPFAIIKATCLTPGQKDDPHSCYLVEFADRRILAQNIPLDLQINVIAPDSDAALPYYASSLNPDTNQPYTWDEVVSTIWDANNKLGEYPGLPYTPVGVPEGYEFLGADSWQALNIILSKINCAVAYNPINDIFNIVQIGAADLSFDEAFAANDPYILSDKDIKESFRTKIADKVKVYFQQRSKYYGSEYTQTADPRQQVTNSFYAVTVSNPNIAGLETGRTQIFWDDLSALVDVNNNFLNIEDLNARAQDIANTYYQAQLQGAARLQITYDDVINNIVPGAQVKAVAWYCINDVGRGHSGVYTEIVRTIGFLPGKIEAMPLGSYDILGQAENLQPPDFGRHTYPLYFPQIQYLTIITGTPTDGNTQTPKGLYDGIVQFLNPDTLQLITVDKCWIYKRPADGFVYANNTDVFGKISGTVTVTSNGTTDNRPLYVVIPANSSSNPDNPSTPSDILEVVEINWSAPAARGVQQSTLTTPSPCDTGNGSSTLTSGTPPGFISSPPVLHTNPPVLSNNSIASIKATASGGSNFGLIQGFAATQVFNGAGDAVVIQTASPTAYGLNATARYAVITSQAATNLLPGDSYVTGFTGTDAIAAAQQWVASRNNAVTTASSTGNYYLVPVTIQPGVYRNLGSDINGLVTKVSNLPPFYNPNNPADPNNQLPCAFNSITGCPPETDYYFQGRLFHWNQNSPDAGAGVVTIALTVPSILYSTTPTTATAGSTNYSTFDEAKAAALAFTFPAQGLPSSPTYYLPPIFYGWQKLNNDGSICAEELTVAGFQLPDSGFTGTSNVFGSGNVGGFLSQILNSMPPITATCTDAVTPPPTNLPPTQPPGTPPPINCPPCGSSTLTTSPPPSGGGSSTFTTSPPLFKASAGFSLLGSSSVTNNVSPPPNFSSDPCGCHGSTTAAFGVTGGVSPPGWYVAPGDYNSFCNGGCTSEYYYNSPGEFGCAYAGPFATQDQANAWITANPQICSTATIINPGPPVINPPSNTPLPIPGCGQNAILGTVQSTQGSSLVVVASDGTQYTVPTNLPTHADTTASAGYLWQGGVVVYIWGGACTDNCPPCDCPPCPYPPPSGSGSSTLTTSPPILPVQQLTKAGTFSPSDTIRTFWGLYLDSIDGSYCTSTGPFTQAELLAGNPSYITLVGMFATLAEANAAVPAGAVNHGPGSCPSAAASLPSGGGSDSLPSGSGNGNDSCPPCCPPCPPGTIPQPTPTPPPTPGICNFQAGYYIIQDNSNNGCYGTIYLSPGFQPPSTTNLTSLQGPYNSQSDATIAAQSFNLNGFNNCGTPTTITAIACSATLTTSPPIIVNKAVTVPNLDCSLFGISPQAVLAFGPTGFVIGYPGPMNCIPANYTLLTGPNFTQEQLNYWASYYGMCPTAVGLLWTCPSGGGNGNSTIGSINSTNNCPTCVPPTPPPLPVACTLPQDCIYVYDAKVITYDRQTQCELASRSCWVRLAEPIPCLQLEIGSRYLGKFEGQYTPGTILVPSTLHTGLPNYPELNNPGQLFSPPQDNGGGGGIIAGAYVFINSFNDNCARIDYFDSVNPPTSQIILAGPFNTALDAAGFWHSNPTEPIVMTFPLCVDIAGGPSPLSNNAVVQGRSTLTTTGGFVFAAFYQQYTQALQALSNVISTPEFAAYVAGKITSFSPCDAYTFDNNLHTIGSLVDTIGNSFANPQGSATLTTQFDGLSQLLNTYGNGINQLAFYLTNSPTSDGSAVAVLQALTVFQNAVTAIMTASPGLAALGDGLIGIVGTLVNNPNNDELTQIIGKLENFNDGAFVDNKTTRDLFVIAPELTRIVEFTSGVPLSAIQLPAAPGNMNPPTLIANPPVNNPNSTTYSVWAAFDQSGYYILPDGQTPKNFADVLIQAGLSLIDAQNLITSLGGHYNNYNFNNATTNVTGTLINSPSPLINAAGNGDYDLIFDGKSKIINHRNKDGMLLDGETCWIKLPEPIGQMFYNTATGSVFPPGKRAIAVLEGILNIPGIGPKALYIVQSGLENGLAVATSDLQQVSPSTNTLMTDPTSLQLTTYPGGVVALSTKQQIINQGTSVLPKRQNINITTGTPTLVDPPPVLRAADNFGQNSTDIQLSLLPFIDANATVNTSFFNTEYYPSLYASMSPGPSYTSYTDPGYEGYTPFNTDLLPTTGAAVNALRRIDTALPLVGGGDLSRDRVLQLITPLPVAYGGTGQTVLQQGLVFGTGNNTQSLGIGPLYSVLAEEGGGTPTWSQAPIIGNAMQLGVLPSQTSNGEAIATTGQLLLANKNSKYNLAQRSGNNQVSPEMVAWPDRPQGETGAGLKSILYVSSIAPEVVNNTSYTTEQLAWTAAAPVYSALVNQAAEGGLEFSQYPILLNGLQLGNYDNSGGEAATGELKLVNKNVAKAWRAQAGINQREILHTLPSRPPQGGGADNFLWVENYTPGIDFDVASLQWFNMQWVSVKYVSNICHTYTTISGTKVVQDSTVEYSQRIFAVKPGTSTIITTVVGPTGCGTTGSASTCNGLTCCPGLPSTLHLSLQSITGCLINSITITLTQNPSNSNQWSGTYIYPTTGVCTNTYTVTCDPVNCVWKLESQGTDGSYTYTYTSHFSCTPFQVVWGSFATGPGVPNICGSTCVVGNAVLTL